MMIWRIIDVSSLLLCLLLAYFLWRSYKYNKVLAKKYERLLATTGQRSEASEEPQRLEALSTTAEESSAGRQLFRRLCQLMDGPDQIFTDTELDRARLAQLLGTNEHYVSDAVSACTNGGSVTDFINGYRLRHAVRLLSSTNDPIGLIAELSGFSRRSFYRVFDEEYHTSPSEYRKAMRKA